MQDTTKYASIEQDYTSAGLWVFPVYFPPGGDGKAKKEPGEKWGPFQQRPPTSAERASRLQRYRNAPGAGMPCGDAIGVFVLDADSSEAIEYVELRGIPETWLVRTPRPGLHYYLRHPDDFTVRNSAGKIWPGVDIRGLGGYVVAAGSSYVINNTKFSYEWEAGHSPRDLPLAEAPAWLRAKAERETPSTPPAPPQPYRGRVRAWARKAFDANLELLASAQPGTRNTTAWDVSRRLGQLCAGGELLAPTVLSALRAIAESWPNSLKLYRLTVSDSLKRPFFVGQTADRQPIRAFSILALARL